MLCLLLGFLCAIIVIWALGSPDPQPLNLVYSLPGKWYWLKFRLMRFVIGRRQKKTQQEAKKDDLLKSQFGGTGKRDPTEMESKHEFPEDKEWAADAVFFDASNKDGWYLTLGTAQRPNNVINLFFILRIPNVGTFSNEELLTDTNVTSVDLKDEWKTESGFSVKCVEPMKRKPDLKWLILQRLLKRNILLEWTNFGDQFDFDTEVSPTSIAHSLAIEPWSRELFKRLQESHQTHYEQFGFLEGYIKLDDKEYTGIRMTSMRDHTITGYRRWTDIRRYIMMIYHLADGTCIHTSLISMPETVFSHLEFGYVITPDKKKLPVDRIHLHLAHIGEGKRFPERFEYTFEAGKKTYDVKVKLVDSCSFKMGREQRCQVNENMAEFEVNGTRGYGFVEAEYRIEPY
ncbi:unnamed protein product, partial [Mesorhabditis spiculigera]